MACVLSGFPNLVSFHFRVCLAPVLSSEVLSSEVLSSEVLSSEVLSSEVLFSIYLPVVFKDQGL
jgi:hypothetical protein